MLAGLCDSWDSWGPGGLPSPGVPPHSRRSRRRRHRRSAVRLPRVGGPRGAVDPHERRRATSSIANASWSTGAQWRSGDLAGVRVKAGSLVLKKPRKGKLGGRAYQVGTWTSPVVRTRLRAHPADPDVGGGHRGRLGRQGAGPRPSGRRAPVQLGLDGRVVARQPGAAAPLARAARPTTSLASMSTPGRPTTPLTQWQVRVRLYRNAATKPAVRLDRVGAMASALVPRGSTPTSTPGPSVGTVLDVPTYSQMTHCGHYPQWGGGGEAWCSPTSTAMVLGYYGLQPGPFGDVARGHADPQVDHTARMVFDHAYDGTGNWAFNTAYASTLTVGRRLRHPTARPARGRGLHRRRRPAGRLRSPSIASSSAGHRSRPATATCW